VLCGSRKTHHRSWVSCLVGGHNKHKQCHIGGDCPSPLTADGICRNNRLVKKNLAGSVCKDRILNSSDSEFSHHWRPSHPGLLSQLASMYERPYLDPMHMKIDADDWIVCHHLITDGRSTTWEGIKKQRSTNLEISCRSAVHCYRRRPMRLILAVKQRGGRGTIRTRTIWP